MVLSINKSLEMQTNIKNKMQDKPYTFRSINRQREASYLYRVKFSVYQLLIGLVIKKRYNISIRQTIFSKGSLPTN